MNTTMTDVPIENTNMTSRVMPPLPPTAQDLFELKNGHIRPYLEDAYQVITRNEWWGRFRHTLETMGVDTETGFMFSNNPFYNTIMNAISSTRIGEGHSGFSMGFVMREMEQIALYGEETYMQQCIAQSGRKPKSIIRFTRGRLDNMQSSEPQMQSEPIQPRSEGAINQTLDMARGLLQKPSISHIVETSDMTRTLELGTTEYEYST
jgi:hypothetical protein